MLSSKTDITQSSSENPSKVDTLVEKGFDI